MTEQSRELALCLINENTEKFPYSERKALGESGLCLVNRPTMRWAGMAARYANHYEKQYDAGYLFTAEDILSAAADLAEYYETSAKEDRTYTE